MNKPTYKRILEHPDKDEIISKLICGVPSSDISDWLKAKYSNVGEDKFVLTTKILSSFQNTYLDFWQDIQQDIAKTKYALTNKVPVDDIDLVIKKNPSYEDAMVKLASNELDVDKMMAKMALAVETRIAQIYDTIQEDPRNINTKIERAWCEYIAIAGDLLDKYYRWKEKEREAAVASTQIVNNHITLQVVDQHISVFHDVIKEILSQMDLETSLYFMEVFNNKMAALKMLDPGAPPSTEMKMAEAKLLNETINQRLNQ
jgi:hypothetical protein